MVQNKNTGLPKFGASVIVGYSSLKMKGTPFLEFFLKAQPTQNK